MRRLLVFEHQKETKAEEKLALQAKVIGHTKAGQGKQTFEMK
jgi:hypothetical protein